MNAYSLNVATPSIGGYFSSEQLDLLSIIQCKSHEELFTFVHQCRQLNGVISTGELLSFAKEDINYVKRRIFKAYQDTLVLHDSSKDVILDNTISRLGLKKDEIDTIKKIYTGKDKETIRYIKDYIERRHPKDYERIFKQVHLFIAQERDQIKDASLYDEMVLINDNLSAFDTLLIGSAKPEIVINELFDERNTNRFDFYFAQRDLEFAQKNNKHVRFHSLLTKNACEKLFSGRSKEEILEFLKSYVQATIDFVNNFNATHKLADGSPVINAIDLFNEIVSFDKNQNGEYENIWESKFGISIQDICSVFAYAKDNKPIGVSYLYNEPMLENTDRRRKVIETLIAIHSISNGLIDTLGSQTHIDFKTTDEEIRNCYRDFKQLQDKLGIKIQITEFDLSLDEEETLKTIGENPQVSINQVYAYKYDRIATISSIIRESGVNLSGLSYWSLTDKIDFNLERIRTELLSKGIIADINEIKTACGGLFPSCYQPTIKMDESKMTF